MLHHPRVIYMRQWWVYKAQLGIKRFFRVRGRFRSWLFYALWPFKHPWEQYSATSEYEHAFNAVCRRMKAGAPVWKGSPRWVANIKLHNEAVREYYELLDAFERIHKIEGKQND